MAAKAAADEAAPVKKVASGKAVKYIGTADVREIDAASWRNADVEEQGKVRWDKTNKFSIDAAEFSDAALDYLATDAGFVITDADV